MAANDGPVPLRTLAFAARLIRDARQLPRYGITATEPVLHYDRLLERMREVIDAQLLQAAVRAAVESQTASFNLGDRHEQRPSYHFESSR
jgi:pyruvate/2-oxoglutarate dehydrogenase complex dihydrolipoamide dehydrogenase (E3) component